MTIAAIFFALTIGLVVGSLYVSPRVPRTYERAIEVLKKSQSSLDKSNDDLKRERDLLQSSFRQALPFALKGRLNGQTVALVQSGDSSATTADVQDTLTQAGAQITSVTTLERPFQQPDELLLPRLTSLRASDSRYPASRESLAAALAAVFLTGDSTVNGLMPLLQAGGLARYESDSNYSTPVHTVILLTGSQSEASGLAANLDVPLIMALQKNGIAVYACEAQDVVTSSFPAYRAASLQVNTIERVDSDPGRWQLVSALAAPTPAP